MRGRALTHFKCFFLISFLLTKIIKLTCQDSNIQNVDCARRGLCSMNKRVIKHFKLVKKKKKEKKNACVKLKCAYEHQHSNTALSVQLRKFILLELHYLLLSIIHLSRHIWLLWPRGCWQVPFVPWKSCKHFQRLNWMAGKFWTRNYCISNPFSLWMNCRTSHLYNTHCVKPSLGNNTYCRRSPD